MAGSIQATLKKDCSLVDPVVHDGEEPGGALKRVGTAGLQVERAQPPVLQLPQEVPRADRLGQVQLALVITVLHSGTVRRNMFC